MLSLWQSFMLHNPFTFAEKPINYLLICLSTTARADTMIVMPSCQHKVVPSKLLPLKTMQSNIKKDGSNYLWYLWIIFLANQFYLVFLHIFLRILDFIISSIQPLWNCFFVVIWCGNCVLHTFCVQVWVPLMDYCFSPQWANRRASLVPYRHLTIFLVWCRFRFFYFFISVFRYLVV